MYLVAGLGNPGEKYSHTRHNLGFMVLDKLVSRVDTSFRHGPDHDAAVFKLAGQDVLAIKPMTFVNSSGKPISKLIREYNLSPENIVVAYDDIDLEFSKLRIKQGGKSGGHRGIESIIKEFGREDFIRIKIGLGRPPGRQDPADYVLLPFTKKELPEIEVSLEQAADAIYDIITESLDWAMNYYN